MTTSPSWFDQEKFSRLVKKVGAKTSPAQPVPDAAAKINAVPAIKATGPFPAIEASPADPAPAVETEKAPVARDVSVTGSLPVIRMPAVSTTKTTPLPSGKRTTMIKSAPLPVLKPVFAYDKPESTPQEAPPYQTIPETAPSAEKTISTGDAQELTSLREEVADVFKKLQALEGEFSQTNQNLEQARSENMVLRQQLGQAEEASKDRETLATQIGELSHAAQERDQARNEVVALREQLRQAEEIGKGHQNEELSRAHQNLEQVRSENNALRDQLKQAEEAGKDRETLSARVNELSNAAQERDQARTENTVLRDQLKQAEEAGKDRESLAAKISELSNVAEERDQAKNELIDLRELLESMKQENVLMREKGVQAEETHNDLLEQIRKMGRQVTERDEEISQLKTNSVGLEDVIETLKQELNALQEQVHQARDEAAAAQSGLILNQKALQETRDALREASVGSSMTKANLENLKNECSTLVQQNMLLQAQHDQLSRDLSAAKAKLAARS